MSRKTTEEAPSTRLTNALRGGTYRVLLLTAAAAAAATLSACAEGAPQASSPGSEAVATATATPIPAPSGILTFVADGGQYTSIPAADPTHPLVTAAIGPDDHGSAHHRPTTALSPDGRYEANVRRDDQGTFIDVVSGGHVAQSIPIAAPDGADIVAGGKSLARAVDGVPLTIAWSPDSKHLAYGSVTGAPWALNIFSTSTRSFASYEVEGGYVASSRGHRTARASPSPRMSSSANHTVLLLDVETSWIRRLIGGYIVVWSPDGNFVAVRREPLEEPGVWIAPIEGGTDIRVTADTKSYPVAWTEDGASLAASQ